MMGKFKTKLGHIIENVYMELIFFYMILFVIFGILGFMIVIYPIARFVRDVTGRLLDPLLPIAKIVFSFELIIILGFLFFLFTITFITIVRVRKGKFRDGMLIYDIFFNYHRDFKTMSGVVMATIFMVFNISYFLFKVALQGFELYNIFIFTAISIISLNLVAYIGQINKILNSIKNLGKLGEIEISQSGQFLFTQRALDMLQNTDENIKIVIDEQLKSERLKTELITNISHDLKTPLTSIINYTDLLKKHGTEDEQVKGYINVLDRNSQRLKVLITDLVYASKAETGNVDIKLEPLELNELVFQVYGEFDYLFREKDITFVFDPIEDMHVLADSNHLGRVLINIMDNAIKYSQEGTRIYANTRVEGQYTSFTLKNISREKLNISPDELMEQFVRGERSRHTEGNGLGLYISRSLMGLMGGKLTLGIDGDLFEVKLLIPSMEDNEK